MLKIKNILLLVLLVFMTAKSLAYTTDANISQPYIGDDWQSINTKHFVINYPKTHLSFAKRMAAIAEQVYEKYTIYLQWTPSEKVQVVINTSSDITNAFAKSFPSNQFAIYVNPPTDGELMDHTGWVELVFTHEFIHILHFDQVSGWPKVSRSIFGRNFMSFPEMFGPSWLAEGLAVYYESSNGFGRGNNAIYNAQMRQEVINGLHSYSEENFSFGSRWPFGQHYLYGTYFFEFVKQTYGQKILTYYITQYNSGLIPWRMDNRSQVVFNKSVTEVWADYQNYLRKKFTPQIQKIKTQKTQSGKIVVTDKYLNTKLNKANNNSVIYYHNNFITGPSIRQVFKNGKKIELLKMNEKVKTLSVNQHGALLVKKALCDNYKTSHDLYHYDLSKQTSKQITNCMDILNAKWQADGQAIYATQIKNSVIRLLKIQGLNDPKITVLNTLKLGEAIGKIDVSPDFSKLVASVKRKNTGWNLEIFDLKQKIWQKITHSKRLERNPKYAGGFIYYVADNDSRTQLELYRLNLKNNTTEQLTNSLGYVVDFTVGDNQSLWLSIYGKNGQKIKFINKIQSINPKRNNPADPVNLNHLISTNLDTSGVKVGEKYRAFDTMAPTSWMPSFNAINQFSFYGLNISGSDILGFHKWKLAPTFYPEKPLGEFAGLMHYNFYNLLTLSFNKSIKPKSKEDGINKYDQKTTSQIYLHYPISSTNWTLDTGIAISQSTDKKLEINDKIANIKQSNTDYLTGIVLNFNNLAKYSHIISPSNTPMSGFDLNVINESYQAGKGIYKGGATIVKIDNFIGITGEHIFGWSGLIARGSDTIKPFQLGGIGDPIKNSLHPRDFALKGYDAVTGLKGTNVNRLSLKYIFPVMKIYDGGSIVPLGFGEITGKLSLHSGAAWDTSQTKKYYNSQSLEFKIGLYLGHIPVTLTVGYAEGLDKELGKKQTYTSFGLVL